MTSKAAAEKWEELERTGLFDDLPYGDKTPVRLVVLSEDDLPVIEAALRRHFIAIKGGRMEIIHAMQSIRSS